MVQPVVRTIMFSLVAQMSLQLPVCFVQCILYLYSHLVALRHLHLFLNFLFCNFHCSSSTYCAVQSAHGFPYYTHPAPPSPSFLTHFCFQVFHFRSVSEYFALFPVQLWCKTGPEDDCATTAQCIQYNKIKTVGEQSITDSCQAFEVTTGFLGALQQPINDDDDIVKCNSYNRILYRKHKQ